MTEISRQLDRLTAAEGAPIEDEPASRTGRGGAGLHQDREDRPAHAQRGRGLLRVAGESRPDSRQSAGRNPALHRRRRAVLVSEAARRFLHIDRDSILGLHAREIFDRLDGAGPHAARGHRRRRQHGEGRDSHRKRAAHPGLGGLYLRRRNAPGAGRAGDAARSGIGGGDRVGAGALAAHGGHRPAHLGRGPRGKESHQRDRGASGASEIETGRSGTARRRGIWT